MQSTEFLPARGGCPLGKGALNMNLPIGQIYYLVACFRVYFLALGETLNVH
jgi:hypothetical protein